MRSFRSRGADERKAMFANMLNSRYHPMMRFAEKSKPVAESVKVPSPPLEVPESPISGGSYKADVLPSGEDIDTIGIPNPEDIEFDLVSNVGKSSVIPPIKDEIPLPEVEHGSVEPEVFDGELNAGVPPVVGNIPPHVIEIPPIPPPVIEIPPEVEHGSSSGRVPKFEDIEFDLTTNAVEAPPPMYDEHWDDDPADDRGLDKPPIPKRQDDFIEKVGAGFYSGLESGRKQLGENIIKKSSELGRGLTSGELELAALKYPLAALKYPGKKLKSMHIPAHLKSWGRQAVAVALPAAEAFGATAGTGVTEALRATGNLITDPKRELYIPPGFQRVWTGEGDKYKMLPISTPQMQPAHFNAGMGMSMPMGVSAEPADIAGAAKGSMNAPFFRQIDDVGKSAEVKMGTLKAGKIMERSRSDGRVLSPMERISRMGFKEASEAFMAERGGGRPRESARESSMYQPKPKSDKQIMSESILSMPMMQAAEGFMKHAKVELSRPSAPVYVQQRRVAPTVPVRVDIPLSSGSARGVMA